MYKMCVNMYMSKSVNNNYTYNAVTEPMES